MSHSAEFSILTTMGDLLPDSIKRLINAMPNGLSTRISVQTFTEDFSVPFR